MYTRYIVQSSQVSAAVDIMCCGFNSPYSTVVERPKSKFILEDGRSTLYMCRYNVDTCRYMYSMSTITYVYTYTYCTYMYMYIAHVYMYMYIIKQFRVILNTSSLVHYYC